MSHDDLVTIRKYGTSHEAHLAKSLLAGTDIPASVADEATATWLWHIGTALGGAKLQVARRDADRARSVLAESGFREPHADDEAWQCPHCGAEVDAGFDVCWSCELPRNETGFDGAASPPKPAANADVHREFDDASELAESADDVEAARAWRAALIGLAFPPILLYALYLTLRIMNRELSPRGTRRFYGALAISLVMISLWWMAIVRL